MKAVGSAEGLAESNNTLYADDSRSNNVVTTEGRDDTQKNTAVIYSKDRTRQCAVTKTHRRRCAELPVTKKDASEAELRDCR